ncbi:acyl-CoA dehydrogenase family protein [Embleya scabrispora]|uniref:acyl-CoA dehydrogenase family protein n=1 Tax=Embleya scabrispora TaxID=159449 RepID=UPI001319DDE4|nr:acyl-CoA dehydrogenase family protein [Embleya scabrispora]MYS80785.1 acyl-CoA dehydrogenase [Streptomyces sp. SID5474]
MDRRTSSAKLVIHEPSFQPLSIGERERQTTRGERRVDFALTAEQELVRKEAGRFAQTQLAASSSGTGRTFSRELWRRCAEFGVQGMPFPAEYGGQGADLITTVLTLEELGYGCHDNGLLFSLGAHMWSCALPIWRFGDARQRDRYLPSLCNGSAVGVQAVTEVRSGSDALAVRTAARACGDEYILDGVKTFITNAPVADVFVVLAQTGSVGDLGGLCAFVVDRKQPGISVGEPVEKLGLASSPMSEVVLDDCRVPAAAMLGGPGAGMTVFNTTIEWERSFILATALGTMRRQLEESIAHARAHTRFGEPIGRNQAVAHRIADMRVRLEAARLLLYRVAWLKDEGRRTSLESSVVKLFLSEAFVESSMAAFTTHGADAYMSGAAQERDVRDALASRIYSGTSDLQRVIIARMLGL